MDVDRNVCCTHTKYSTLMAAYGLHCTLTNLMDDNVDNVMLKNLKYKRNATLVGYFKPLKVNNF